MVVDDEGIVKQWARWKVEVKNADRVSWKKMGDRE